MNLRALIVSDDIAGLDAALRELSPAQRKELAAELITYERAHRTSDARWRHQHTLAVAGAGLLPTASKLAPWLLRNGVEGVVEVTLGLLRHREVPWLADLGVRLAAGISRRGWDHELFALIVACCGDNPPDSDGFIQELLYLGPEAFRPGYDVLIPRVFEVEGAGGWLSFKEWPAFLSQRSDRALLLDCCLARLQRPGGQQDIAGFLEFHELLAPTLGETATHARDYVAMLSGTRSGVATVAQKQLKRLDDAGQLDFELLCDASRWVFGRTEKKLIGTQLSWLAKHGTAHPDEVVRVAAELFRHESADLAARAVAVVEKHISDATRAEVLALAADLPGDLAAQLGGEKAAEDAVVLAPFVAMPFPEPFTTLDELVVELRAMTGHERGKDPVVLEQVLAALVTFAWQDRDALIAVLDQLFEQHPWLAADYAGDFYQAIQEPGSAFHHVLRAAREHSRPHGPFAEAVRAEWHWHRQVKRSRSGPVEAQLTLRLHEIERGLRHSPRPALVSTPTEASGLIDPATLAERLAKADADGWVPWPRDLRQAIDRLPSDLDPAVFAQVPGKAARQLRVWLARRTHPVVTLAERTHSYPRHSYRPEPVITEVRLLATVTPGLPEPEKHLAGYRAWGSMTEWWPSLLPAHRDAVAAHLAPHLSSRRDSKGSDGPLLPLLAAAHGPVGPGLHLALSFGLGAALPVNRAHAVDALLTLAARSQLDGTALGSVLGRLAAAGDLVPSRVVPALRDAARGGAAGQVWDLLAAALPNLWDHRRVPDFLELTVELAQRLRPGGTIDGLAEVAARKGSGRAVKEARRLVAALAV